jgi:hypothetical protein
LSVCVEEENFVLKGIAETNIAAFDKLGEKESGNFLQWRVVV